MKRKFQSSSTEKTTTPSKKRTRSSMHPRNRYNTPPDFGVLAARDSSFREHVTIDSDGRVKVNWNDMNVQRAVTKALMLHDFGIKWDLPPGYLVPPIPNRLNYILWIEDLLSLTSQVESPSESVRGIDIGTGANVIYPLLGCALHREWSWVATEIDAEAAKIANGIVSSNDLLDRINIRIADESSPHVISQVLTPDDEDFDFCCCNPPFYSTADEAVLNPYAASEGTASELVTEGGEIGFVTRIIEDSATIPRRVRWFTSMVGKKSSLKPLRKALTSLGAYGVYSTEFCQGQTSRWGIAWTFMETSAAGLLVLKDDARTVSARPACSEVEWSLPLDCDAIDMVSDISEAVSSVEHAAVRVSNFFESEEFKIALARLACDGDTATHAYTLTTESTTSVIEKGTVIRVSAGEGFRIVITLQVTGDGIEKPAVKFSCSKEVGTSQATFNKVIELLRSHCSRSSRRWRRARSKQGLSASDSRDAPASEVIDPKP